MYNINRQSLNYGYMPNYYPTLNEHCLVNYPLNHRYFSSYIKTDIGICFGLESVNLNSGQQIIQPAENILFYPSQPDFYETRNHCEFPISSRCNLLSVGNANNIVEYYRKNAESSYQTQNYSLDTIYEQQLATNVSSTINSRWNNYNETISPKKKWMRHYMMSKNIFVFQFIYCHFLFL